MQSQIAANHHPDSAPFAIGDLQGCAPSFSDLLELLPNGAPLRLVGDLVNRGPAWLETLRTIEAMGDRVRTVLGNHDIHLLAVAAGVRKKGKSDTFDDILEAPDCDALITWLRHQPMAIREDDFLIVHAGILPQWSADQVIALAQEVEAELQGPAWKAFLAGVFGNSADRWRKDLIGIERHRVIVNALTRLRYCSEEGVMDLKTKEGPDSAPTGVMPWFDAPARRTDNVTVVCGHWSTLGLVMRPNLISLDTGCVWGGKLTAVQLAARPEQRTIIQVNCPQYQDPLA